MAQANQVFIGGLTSETTLENLTSHLALLGEDPISASFFEGSGGRSRGCALAVYQTADEAAAAISTVDNSTLNEKEIFARIDRGPRRSEREPRFNQDQSYIYVGNLGVDVTSEDLTTFFSAFGTIQNVAINRNRRTDNAMAWGTVQFSTVDEALAAQAMHGKELQGLELTVEPLKKLPRAKTERKPRAALAEKVEEVEEVDNCVLYVGNLPWTAEEQTLMDLFAVHGEVMSTEIVREKRSGKPRGWGTVTFATEEQAAAAMAQLDKAALEDREIDVQIRKGRRKAMERKPRRARGPAADGEESNGRRRADGRRRRRNDGESTEDAERPRRERKEPEPVVVSNPGCHLYVGNLAWEVSEDDLTELFAKYGTVAKADIARNRRENRSRGWGTIEMGSTSEAEVALANLNEFPFMERQLIVRLDTRVTSA